MIAATGAISTVDGRLVPIGDVPVVPLDRFRESLQEQLSQGSAALLALFGVPSGPQTFRLYSLTSVGATGEIWLLATDVGDRYPSLTQHMTQAHWFERELAEQWGIVPEKFRGLPVIDSAKCPAGCVKCAEACPTVDMYIPGCPPHPLTILDGLLRLLGRIENK